VKKIFLVFILILNILIFNFQSVIAHADDGNLVGVHSVSYNQLDFSKAIYNKGSSFANTPFFYANMTDYSVSYGTDFELDLTDSDTLIFYNYLDTLDDKTLIADFQVYTKVNMSYRTSLIQDSTDLYYQSTVGLIFTRLSDGVVRMNSLFDIEILGSPMAYFESVLTASQIVGILFDNSTYTYLSYELLSLPFASTDTNRLKYVDGDYDIKFLNYVDFNIGGYGSSDTFDIGFGYDGSTVDLSSYFLMSSITYSSATYENTSFNFGKDMVSVGYDGGYKFVDTSGAYLNASSYYVIYGDALSVNQGGMWHSFNVLDKDFSYEFIVYDIGMFTDKVVSSGFTSGLLGIEDVVKNIVGAFRSIYEYIILFDFIGNYLYILLFIFLIGVIIFITKNGG
jgi:hypothetical protein